MGSKQREGGIYNSCHVDFNTRNMGIHDQFRHYRNVCVFGTYLVQASYTI